MRYGRALLPAVSSGFGRGQCGLSVHAGVPLQRRPAACPLARLLRAPAPAPAAREHAPREPNPIPAAGNALMWESKVYDDATTYEGLTREGIPHGKGIMVFGNWTGGGFQHPQRGDRCGALPARPLWGESLMSRGPHRCAGDVRLAPALRGLWMARAPRVAREQQQQ